MANNSSLVGAARARTAPTLTDFAEVERRILDTADPAQESPSTALAHVQQNVIDRPSANSASSALDRLAARKPAKIQLTPLHVNIPITLDNALARVVKEKGIEKTAIVIEALKSILEPYL